MVGMKSAGMPPVKNINMRENIAADNGAGLKSLDSAYIVCIIPIGKAHCRYRKCNSRANERIHNLRGT